MKTATILVLFVLLLFGVLWLSSCASSNNDGQYWGNVSKQIQRIDR